MKIKCLRFSVISHFPCLSPNLASCGSKTESTGNASLCYIIAGRFELLVGVDSIADVNSVYCKFLETTRAYFMSSDIMEQIREVTSINSTIASSLVPNFCSYQTMLSASQASDKGTSDKNTMSAKRVVPIAIGLFAILVATATILMYARYSTTSVDIAIDQNPSSDDSDLNFQNSDETDEFEVDPTATVDAERHYQVTHSKHKRITPNRNMSLAAVEEHGATASPSPTEQEIVFTPSSSVATSALFRSP